jgi:hypothetical protein
MQGITRTQIVPSVSSKDPEVAAILAGGSKGPLEGHVLASELERELGPTVRSIGIELQARELERIARQHHELADRILALATRLRSLGEVTPSI